MESAAKVFAWRGLQHASIDEVAEEAGYTKGAFYANFKSKEELFLAMLDDRFAEQLAQVDRAVRAQGEPEDQARRFGIDFVRYLTGKEEWERLFFEFAAYATRNEKFRRELVTRYRSLRERLAELYRSRAEELGVEPAVPVEELALMTFAMANGVALEKLLEPEAVSEELYGTMLAVFFKGLGAMAPEGGATSVAAAANAR